MKKINSFHHRISSPKYIGIFFIFFIILFMAFRLLTPEFEKLSGGIKIPDIAIAFYGDNLYSLFKLYGEGARGFYGYIQIVDLFYPTAYGLFFLSVILFYLERLFKKNSILRYIALIPYLAVIFDYSENLTIFIMNRVFPGEFGVLADVSLFVSYLKWVFFISSVLLVLLGTIYFIIKKIFGNIKNEAAV